MSAPKDDFIPLSSLRQEGRDAKAILAEIREIYFKTTRPTIAQDFDHAIALLMSLPAEEDREKATVYMEGLAEMRKEWSRSAQPRKKSTKQG